MDIHPFKPPYFDSYIVLLHLVIFYDDRPFYYFICVNTKYIYSTFNSQNMTSVAIKNQSENISENYIVFL